MSYWPPSYIIMGSSQSKTDNSFKSSSSCCNDDRQKWPAISSVLADGKCYWNVKWRQSFPPKFPKGVLARLLNVLKQTAIWHVLLAPCPRVDWCCIRPIVWHRQFISMFYYMTILTLFHRLLWSSIVTLHRQVCRTLQKSLQSHGCWS